MMWDRPKSAHFLLSAEFTIAKTELAPKQFPSRPRQAEQVAAEVYYGVQKIRLGVDENANQSRILIVSKRNQEQRMTARFIALNHTE